MLYGPLKPSSDAENSTMMALMSLWSAERLKVTLRAEPLSAPTPHTISDPVALADRLADIRRNLKKYCKLHRVKHRLQEGFVGRSNRKGEGRFLDALMNANDGNVSKAARAGGFNRSQLQKMLARHR